MVEWCIHRQRSLEYRQKKRCKVQAWMWVEWCLNMLYYELINKRLPEISISLTSGIRVDGGVQYGEVVQTQTKVPRVRTKKKKRCKVRAWMSVLGVKGKGFMALACIRIPRVEIKMVQAMSMDKSP